MTDETETQPQGEQAPAEPAQPETPATTAPVDVESIVSTRLAEWEEKRIKPLQNLISERDQTIQQLKTASMSEEEREQLRIEEEESRIASLERENWLLKQAGKNPTAAELFKKVLDAESDDEQFAIFADLANRLAAASTPAPAPEPEPSEQVPDVDPNNPAPSPTDFGTLPDGTPINRSLAEDFFKKLTSWPTNR